MASVRSKGAVLPSSSKSPGIFAVLDAPGPGACLARLLTVPEAVHLLSTSWMLYKGVVGRTTGILHHAFLGCGYDTPGGDNDARLAAWLYACRLPGRPRPRRRNGPAAASSEDDGTGIGGEIDRDVCRTFPDRPSFSVGAVALGPGGLASADTWTQLGASSGLGKLRSVLHAFSDARPEVGYCQGMNYVAATLLEAAAEPVKRLHAASGAAAVDDAHVDAAFELLCGLNDAFDCCDLWAPGLPRLPCLAFQLSEMMRRKLPLLHEHLARIGFHFEVLAAQWLLTLLATALPPATLYRVWDEMFESASWKAPMRAIIAVLGRVEERALQTDIAGIALMFRLWKDAISASGSDAGPEAAAALLQEWPELAVIFSPRELVRAARSIKVTRSMLAASEEEYSLRVIQQKIAAGLGASPLPPRLFSRDSEPPNPALEALAASGAPALANTADAAVRETGVDDMLRLLPPMAAVAASIDVQAVPRPQLLPLPLVLSPDVSPDTLRQAFDAPLLVPLSVTVPAPHLRSSQPSQLAFRLHRRTCKQQQAKISVGSRPVASSSLFFAARDTALGSVVATATAGERPLLPRTFTALSWAPPSAGVVVTETAQRSPGPSAVPDKSFVAAPQSVLRLATPSSRGSLLSPSRAVPHSSALRPAFSPLLAPSSSQSSEAGGSASARRPEAGHVDEKPTLLGPAATSALSYTATHPHSPAHPHAAGGGTLTALDVAIAALPGLLLSPALSSSGLGPASTISNDGLDGVSATAFSADAAATTLAVPAPATPRGTVIAAPLTLTPEIAAPTADLTTASEASSKLPPTQGRRPRHRHQSPHHVPALSMASPHGATGAPILSPQFGATRPTADEGAVAEPAFSARTGRSHPLGVPGFMGAPSAAVTALGKQLSGLVGSDDSARLDTLRRRLEFEVETSARAVVAAAAANKGEMAGDKMPASRSPPSGGVLESTEPHDPREEVPLPGGLRRRTPTAATDVPSTPLSPLPDTSVASATPANAASASLCRAVLALPRAVPGTLAHRLHAAAPPAVRRQQYRLDGSPVFFLLLHALAGDLGRIDTTARADVVVMTRKVAAIKAATIAAADGVEKLRATLQDAEKRTSQVLGLKRAAARRLHRLMMGLPEEEDAAGEGRFSTGSGGGTEAASFRSPPPAPNRPALSRYSSLLSSLDARVKDASATWRAALWEHTLADTRLGELQDAQSALMDQLVAVMLTAEAEKAELCARLWHTVVLYGRRGS